jgi:hypothetical protein
MIVGAGKEMQVDLKGCIYSATIVPSNTFFIVNVGPTEAKVRRETFWLVHTLVNFILCVSERKSNRTSWPL